MGDCDDSRLGRVVGDASSPPELVELKLVDLPEPPESAESVSSRVVVDLWESVGVHRPRKLLADLGFGGDRLDLGELLDCVEEEIFSLSSNFRDASDWSSSLVLFRAVLCLYRYEIDNAKALLGRTAAERDKLRADLSDANRRAALLADDVDENHLRLEAASESRLRSLERKHRETVQRLTAQFDAEKDASAATIRALETRTSALRAEETKLRSRLEAIDAERERSERERSALRDDVRELRETNGRLAREVRALSDERGASEERDGAVDADVARLEGTVRDLKTENVRLRDGNDELAAELERLNATLAKYEGSGTPRLADEERDQGGGGGGGNGVKRRGSSPSRSRSELDGESPRINKVRKRDDDRTSDAPPNGDKIKSLESFIVRHAFEKNFISSEFRSDEDAIDGIILDLKNGDRPALRELFGRDEFGLCCLAFYYLFHEIKNNVGRLPALSEECAGDDRKKLELCLNEIDESRPGRGNENGPEETRGSRSDIRSELSIARAEGRIADLEKSLEEERTARRLEIEKRDEKCRELETSVESLRAVYEESEEYWATKLKEEREMFDQEQQINDEKFSDLMNKLAEYEEQFALKDNKGEFRNGPLSTIEEKFSLEKQFTDLEEEFQEYKTRTRLELDGKNSEIERLKEAIASRGEKIENIEADVSRKNENEPGSGSSFDAVDSHPIASPIEYLWNQKTITPPMNGNRSAEAKTRDYQNPIFLKDRSSGEDADPTVENPDGNRENVLNKNETINISPIQKPCNMKILPSRSNGRCDYVGCFDRKLEGKMLHCSDLEQALQGRQRQNRDQDNIQTKYNPDLHSSHNRRMLPQDHENAKVFLEVQCRQLQSALLQQQAYAENMMQQTLAMHRSEIGALKQKLAAADLLIRDLYVENCHLTENIINPPLL